MILKNLTLHNVGHVLSSSIKFACNVQDLSLWHSGSVRDSQPSGPVSLPEEVSHCVIEAGKMCKLTVALTSGRLVH